MADRFDLDAIEADDALLDLLAAGGESAWAAGEHDPALKLLADLRLAVEVEDELPVETIDDPESFLARCAALNPVTDPFARKMAARSLALGVAAVAALSVSGVAAAVTGDPLSPYEKVIEKVVDGLREETSFPKEQLDGMPVVDKTKIVKVAKNYQENQEEAKEAQQAKDDEQLVGAEDPARAQVAPKPPLARPVPQTEQQLLIEQPIVPVAPPVEKPAEKPAEPPAEKPVNPEPTEDPTAPVEPKPTEDPTPTTPPPTEEPTTPPPTEPANEPTTAPSTPPPSDNGSTGNPGQEQTTPPTTGPSTGTGDTGTVDTGTGDTGTVDTGTETETGDQTAPGGQTGDSKDDEPGGDQTGQPGDQSDQGNKDEDKPADPIAEVTKVAEAVAKVVPVLPTPTGSPAEEPVRLRQYFGKGFSAAGKHSSDKPALGWAKSQYAKGKHSNGRYPEGQHAAIARAHGSMAPVTIRQILSVLNTPMPER